MKKAVFLFLLLQLATGLSVLFAQATNFEGYEIPEQKEIINDTALFNRLNSLENDFTKFKMIDELLEKAYYSKKLLNYVYLQLDFAKKKESGKLMAHSYYNLARMYYNAEEYDTSITYYKKAEFIYKSLNNDSVLSNIYYELSKAYFFVEQSDMMVYELKKAVVYVTKVSNTMKMAKYLRGIGTGYLYLGQYDSALNYLNKSLKISLKNNLNKNTIFTYSILGSYYNKIKKYKLAIEKQYLAFKYLNGHDFPRARLIVSMRIAKDYINLNKPDSALKYCNYLLNHSKPGRLRNTAYIIAAKIYNYKNDFNKALAYIDSANIYIKKINNLNLRDRMYNVYVDIYTKKNDIEKVLYYKNLQIANYGLMIKKNNMSRLMNINILSTVDKFEESNKLLQEQKRENEIMLENSKKLNILFGVISLLGITVVVVILLFLRRIKVKQQIIKEQNKKLQNKNVELEKTLNQLHNAQSKLLQSEKMASLGMLSAGIAHEINNPINFVYAGINSLLRDFEDIKPVITKINDLKYDDENLKEKVKSIEKLKKENYFDEAFGAIPEILEDIKLGADRTAEIVKGLRVFSGSDKNESELIDIHEAINTSLILLKNKYKRRINIIQNYGNNIPLLNCFPVKINQAFLNIISNAIDAIEGEGKIWITTRKEKNNIVVSIKDSGKGIDKKIINKLFDPFFTTKDVGKGTGLGLAITYGIIQEHNGSIKVVSEPGKGTEFIITLPLTDKD